MGKAINILIVEDSVDDTALLVDELKAAGFDPQWKRVETEPDFLAELEQGPDIILSDYAMPQFNGLRAAQLTRESGLDIPLILISGTVGEDIAVEAMKLGATDYLLKDRIARLGNAVERALENKRLRDERRCTEKSLVQLYRRYELILNSVVEGIHGIDPQGNITFENAASAKMFGREINDMVGRPAHALMHHTRADGSAYPVEQCPIYATLRDGIIRRVDDEVFWRKDGTSFPVEYVATPARDEDGDIIGAVVVFHNITERRQLEKQLRQSQKMEAIGQLAGGVAHDFNNILAVIQLQADMLKTEPDLPPAHLEYADEILNCAERAANLTRQLLLFSRQQTLQPRDLDLNDIIANVTKMLHRVLGEDIRMQFKYAGKPLMMHADPGMIDQILMNLTVNARDAMPEGGQLIVETAAVEFDELAKTHSPQARPGAFACLSVSDTGCGIPKEILPRIFEPFFTTKEVGKGTGLGLATVFGIVQQHQGWINVYSEAGKGTTFRIYLPRLPQTAGTKATRESPAPVRGGNETILLVEDDRALRAALRNALSRLGYRVLEATTGDEALEVWRQNGEAIQLVLTDMIMPGGINGKELAQQLMAKNPKLKVIYASGYSDKIAGKEMVLEEGVNFLIKPFETHKLAQTVRNCLDGV